MTRISEWFTRNSVAANLLMIMISLGGLATLPGIKQEIFPGFASDMISIRVPFPGAAPDEVEEGVCVRVEEAVQGITGIKKIRSTAVENVGVVVVELLQSSDVSEVLDEVKAAVDAIDTFPSESKQPMVQKVRKLSRVLNVAISGDLEEAALTALGEQVRDEIASLPEITQAKLAGVRPYEISIEISENRLREYHLTFDEVANALRKASLDLPGGVLKTAGGEVMVRTRGQAYRAGHFEALILRSNADGTRLRLGDVARVVDGFADTDQRSVFDGARSVLVQVFRVGDQGALAVAEAVRAYVEKARHRMPRGVSLTTWQDDSKTLRDRLDLLLRNGRAGLALVFLSLAIFLRPSLAAWVSLGIPISFLGAIWLMPWTGVSINLVSLFAFIVVLGIVVDDAIVVGESIFTRRESGESPLAAAIHGVREVAVPVTFAVLTTIAAFFPLLMVSGNMGKLMKQIPTVVILTLVFSLLESLFVLPAHLAHLGQGKPRLRIAAWWREKQDRFHARYLAGIERFYAPALGRALRHRYLTCSIAISLLMLTVASVAGGWVKFVFFPPVEAENVVAMITMPLGTPAAVTEGAVEWLEKAAEEVRAEAVEEEGYDVVEHVLATVGEQPFGVEQDRLSVGGEAARGGHLGEVNIQLLPAEDRELDTISFADRWRERVGPVAGATELTFTSALIPGGAPIDVQLTGRDTRSLTAAAAEVRARLADYPGVFDITDSARKGKRELQLGITPEGQAAGLSLATLARQVRQGFYGEEVQRVQRGRHDVKVMLRYSEEERSSLAGLENMRLRLPSGANVPFSTVARVESGRASATIQRVDRKRSLSVTADVDLEKGNPSEIRAALNAELLPEILSRYPGVSYSLEGEQREQADTLTGLLHGFVFAMLAIYALLAIPFRSYLQPLIIMAAIPFGIQGALWGHWIMGRDLTVLSIFGIVALTGVVVNDSLVLVDYINRRRADGMTLADALRRGGVARFRPIMLTSLTTFAGLTPILLEKSMQAQFLIPMAISLAFGVLFATGVTMFLIPLNYMILEDIRGWLGFSSAAGSGVLRAQGGQPSSSSIGS